MTDLFIATHKNTKSGAEVTKLREYAGQVQFRDGSKLRRMVIERFMRDYQALDATCYPLPPPRVLVKPANYELRRMDETALTRQRLQVTGSQRKKLTKADRDEMATVGTIPFCCRCGKTTNLQVAHAPSGIFGRAWGIKGNGGLLTRLCSVDADSCHTLIDQHKIPDWAEEWKTAFCRSQAWLFDNRKAA